MDLIVNISGAIQESNFEEYKKGILAEIKSQDKNLVTDQDFLDAKAVIANCKSAELYIKNTKQQSISGMADVNKLYMAMDEVAEQLRVTRLSLDKKVKSEMEDRKESLVAAELSLIGDHISSVAFKGFAEICRPWTMTTKSKLINSYKGKSSLSSIEVGLKEESMSILKDIISLQELCELNDATIREVVGDYMSLVADYTQIITKDNDSVRMICQSRVREHLEQQESAKRREEEAKEKARAYNALKQKNEEGAAVESIERGSTLKAKEATASQSYLISLEYAGDAIGANHCLGMIGRLFDDDFRVRNITVQAKQDAA